MDINENLNEETTSQKLFSHLFEACNILRGPINQDDYKSYVTPILFFKRLSDVYDEETQIALDESDGDEEYAAFPENHSFVIPEGCHWKDVREVSENVGTAIVNAMYGIERQIQIDWLECLVVSMMQTGLIKRNLVMKD